MNTKIFKIVVATWVTDSTFSETLVNLTLASNDLSLHYIYTATEYFAFLIIENTIKYRFTTMTN